MIDEIAEPWLVLCFGRELSLARLADTERSSIILDHDEYLAMNGDYLPTFHDRLLDDRSRLVGIRIWPVSTAAQELVSSLVNTRHLTTGEGFVDVWLSEAPVPIATSAGDQAFGARIYRSGSGIWALAMNIGFLCTSESDWASVEQANARWVTVD